MHDVHSAAWCSILQVQYLKQRISDHSWLFLRFWLTDFVAPENETPLFHGHVFGLHPAAGPFMSCKEGRELMGRWIVASTPGNEAESERCFRRLLHGLLVALGQYDLTRSERPDSLRLTGDPDELESRRHHRNRRKGGPKHED